MNKLDINKIKNNLNTEYIGKNIIYFQEIGSTNDWAFELLGEHLKEGRIYLDKVNGTLIIAEIQNKGRGRLERNWISPAGGLWFSIILIPGLDLKDLQNITLISALAAVKVLNSTVDNKIRIKWPNDIYFKNKKVGGILVESEKVDGRVVLISGFGLNVNFQVDEAFPDKARVTSLRSIAGEDLNRENLLCSILEEFEKYYGVYIYKRKFSAIFKEIERLMDY